MRFLDRFGERAKFGEYIENYRVLIYQGNPASGMSTFLKNMGEFAFLNFPHPNNLFVYLEEFSEITSLSQLLFEALMKRKEFQKHSVEILGRYPNNIGAALLKDAFPIFSETAGALFDNFVSGKSLPTGIYAGDNTSMYYECIQAYFKKKSRIVIAIDNASFLTTKALEELQRYAELPGVVFVLGWVNKPDQGALLHKVINKFHSEEVASTRPHFSGTSFELISMVSQELGLSLSDEQINKVIGNHSSNIHMIVEELYRHKNGRILELTSPLLEQAVRILTVLRSGVTELLLRHLLEGDRQTYSNTHNISELLEQLQKSEYIEHIGLHYRLVSEFHPYVERCTREDSDMLLVKSFLCNFFNQNQSLLYDSLPLMKTVLRLLQEMHLTDYPIFEKINRKFISVALASGVTVEPQWLAVLSRDNPDDILLNCIIDVRDRKYEKAFRNIQDSGLPVTANRSIESLHAILLNRLRRHTDSFESIQNLYQSSRNKNEKALFASYQLVNLIHSQQIIESKDYFMKCYDEVVEADYSSYLLRNAAILFEPATAIRMLEEAEYKFKEINDDFGQCSCKNNRARQLMLIGDYQQAEKVLREALLAIKPLSNIHHNIIYNNLACAYLGMGERSHSRRYLELALNLSNTSMPKAFTLMNKALIFGIEGNQDLAMHEIRKVRDESDFNLHRVQQMYASTQCFLDFKFEGKVSQQHIELMERNKDQYNPYITERQIDAYRQADNCYDTAIDQQVLYPCLLEYWYVNPIKLLESHGLSL